MGTDKGDRKLMTQSASELNAQIEAWQRAGHLSKYIELATAEFACRHATRPLWIVLGDDERYWVTTPRIAAELEQLGYQIL